MLTVGESQRFAERGGMIGFRVTPEGRVAFDINLQRAEQSGLRIELAAPEAGAHRGAGAVKAVRWLADLPIGSKLTLLAGAASAIALLVSSVAFIAYDRATFDESTVRRVSGEAAIVAANSATAIVFRDPEDGAGDAGGARRGARRDGGRAVHDGRHDLRDLSTRAPERPIRPALPSLRRTTWPATRSRTDDLIVHRRVMFEGAPVGTLVIRYDLAERWERLRRYLATVAAVSLAALLAALLAGRLAGRAISGPILALAGTARAVSERGDFSVRAVPRGRDEVGVLVATFNEMLDGLQRRDAELRRVQAELEQRVEERTGLLREAEDANRLKDQFLATLSHELRTPLNAIVGWTTLLMQGNLRARRRRPRGDRHRPERPGPDQAHRGRARRLPHRLRQAAPERAAPSTWPRWCKAAAESVSHAATAKRIRLKLLLEAGTAPVSGDPDRLQQVVWNLLSNAIKFTPAGGTVTVRVEQGDSSVNLVVRDDGAGIAPDFLPHVFERFRQADASTTRAYGGLGLGLSIVRHLVELHGGTVRAESEGPGRGATFTVALPLIAEAPAPPPARAPLPAVRRPGPARPLRAGGGRRGGRPVVRGDGARRTRGGGQGRGLGGRCHGGAGRPGAGRDRVRHRDARPRRPRPHPRRSGRCPRPGGGSPPPRSPPTSAPRTACGAWWPGSRSTSASRWIPSSSRWWWRAWPAPPAATTRT